MLFICYFNNKVTKMFINKKFFVLLSSLFLMSCSNNYLSNLNQDTSYQILNYNQLNNLGGIFYNDFSLSPNLPKNKEDKNSIKLTYFMTDDYSTKTSLSKQMLSFMDDFPQKNIHNIIFRDGGEIGDSKLYYLDGGHDSSSIESPASLLAGNITEVQSNNPKVFSEVVKWSFNNYSSKNKYLQIYSNGSAIAGIGSDRNQTDLKGQKLSKDNSLSLIPIKVFSDSITESLNGDKLDIIYFRASMMGNLESLYELRNTTKYVLALDDFSQSKDKSNLNMTKTFDELIAKNLDPKDITNQMVIKSQTLSNLTSFEAIDMSQINNYKKAFDDMTSELLKSLKTEKNNITKSYDLIKKPKMEDITKLDSISESMRDIYDFTEELEKNSNSNELKNSIKKLKVEQKKLMFKERDSIGFTLQGLSVFMPERKNISKNNDLNDFIKNKYSNTSFAKDSNWINFLYMLINN